MNTLEAKLWILDKSETIWNHYSESYNCGSKPPIEFEIKKSNTAGFAYYSGKICFNLTYFCTHAELAELEEIVAHELAHIVQFRCFPKVKQAHGPEFRLIMQLAGYKGDTYHRMSTIKAKAEVKKLKDENILFDL